MLDDLQIDVSSLHGGVAASMLEDVKPEDSSSQLSEEDEKDGANATGRRGKGKAKAKAKAKSQSAQDKLARCKADGPEGEPEKRGNKGKGKGGGSKKRVGDITCEFCDFTGLGEDFPSGCNKCYPCKRDYDSLSRMCVRQNLLDWWKGFIASPLSKRRKVMKEFRTRFRAMTGTAKKDFQLLVFTESFAAISATDVKKTGQMMWKKQAIMFWQSVDGGDYTEDEAIKMWQDLLSDPDHESDSDGPPKAPKRLKVQKSTKVVDRQTQEKRKEMSLTSTKKKFEYADLMRGKKRCVSGHEDIASVVDADVKVNTAALLKSMTSKSISAGFRNDGAVSFDLRATGMAVQDEEMVKDEDTASSGGQQSALSSSSARESPRKGDAKAEDFAFAFMLSAALLG